jgi:hypothetical protein
VDETLEVDLEDLTLGDLRACKRLFRDELDMSWTEARKALDEGDPDAVAIVALVIKRKADPLLKLDDMDGMKITAPEPDPTSAGG